MSKRPSQKRVNRIQERDEKRPERRENGKTRARTCVRFTPQWTQQDQSEYDRAYRQPIALGTCREPHISIPKMLLNRNPATSESAKNSQIQFHSTPTKEMVRAG